MKRVFMKLYLGFGLRSETDVTIIKIRRFEKELSKQFQTKSKKLFDRDRKVP